MPRLRWFILYLAPVLLWMLVIFSASSDRMSMQHSSRIIEPIVRWLFPSLSPHAIRKVVFFFRKCAHAFEYGVLALLTLRALRRCVRAPGPFRTAWMTLGFCTFYAMTDELHQAFVPTRQASVWDILLDSCGAALGLSLAVIWMRVRSRRLSTRAPAAPTS